MNNKKSKSNRKKRALRIRRRVALIIVVLAVIVAILAFSHAPGLSMVMWGAAAVAMIVGAALLYRRRALPAAVYGLLGLLCAALIFGGFQVRGYVFSDAGVVPVEATVTSLRVTDAWPENLSRYTRVKALDLRNSTVSDFTPALSLRGLESLDARGNYHFTEETLQQVNEALPRCQVKWSIPIAGNYYDSDVQDIDVTSQNLSASEIADLQAKYPEKRFHTAAVRVMGMEIDPAAESLDLSARTDVDLEELSTALALLPSVREVDLRGIALSAEAVRSLHERFPEVRFLWRFAVPNGAMTSEDTMVTLTGGTYQDIRARMDFFDYMPSLQYLDARTVSLNEAEIQAIQSDPHGDKVICYFPLYGRMVSAMDTALNLDGVPLSGADEVEQILKTLPGLERLSLCDCGLTDADMDALFTAHPEVKFIWWVQFGRYRLRTDATAFTTNLFANNNYHYDSATFAPLRYCTDLMMLDLGHCDITSLDWMAGLTRLRVLILADNEITDISPLAGMADLEYVELFLNKIRDFSPLANKAHLVDLNIYYCPIQDVTPLTTCTGLKRLWLGQCGLSDRELSQLKSALPDCKINAKGSASTGHGWREHKHYEVLKQMYKQGVYIPFNS